MAANDPNALLDTFAAPMADLIASVGEGVANAQRAMDAASLATLREIYAAEDDVARDMQRIGYRPPWYQIPEVEAELTLALTMNGTTEESGRTRLKMYAAPVDATYTNKFGFELTASSKVRFRVVPVPPPTLEERARIMPTVVGLSVVDAGALLRTLGIAWTEDGAGPNVVAQSLAGGARVEADPTLTRG